MKILHVINSLATGGAERLVAAIAPMQRARGHDVSVLLLRGGASIFRAKLEAAGVPVSDFGAGTSVYSPLHILRIAAVLRRERFDAVHVHLFPAQYWTALAACLPGTGTPRLVTTEHSTENRRREHAVFRIPDRLIYARYDAATGCSAAAIDALAKYLGKTGGGEGGGRPKLVSVENGVDLRAFREAVPAEREAIVPAGCDFLLAQVARFQEHKDQAALIRALAKLPAGVHAIFVGDGERRAACERLAAELGVAERAHFLGVRTDVPALLRAADVAVLPSHWEGFGLAAVEGMAAGKPVIASDVPGLGDVVRGAGLLFPCGDVEALVAAVSQLKNDAAFYAETAQACSRRAEDFSIEKTCDAYLDLCAGTA